MGFSFFKSKDRDKKKTPSAPLPGQRRERSSNPQVSIKLAEHFLRENKRDLAVDEYLNAAQAFLDKRQSQLAMAVYRNIITIDPERYGIYETLADLYRMSGFPGDGASVLLALAYQYQKAGHNTEVKRVLDAVLEFAPDNQVLKRKVEAFFAAERRPGSVTPKSPAAGRTSAAAPAQKPNAPVEQAPAASPDIFAPPSVRTPAGTPAPALKPDAPAGQAPAASPDIFAPPSVRTPAGTPAPALKPDAPAGQAPVAAADIFAPPSVRTPAGTPAPALQPDALEGQAPVAAADIFASGRPPAPVPSAAAAPVLKQDAPAADQTFDLKSALADDLPVPPAETGSPAEASFDLRSALEDDFPDAADEGERQTMSDATAESFFDLQSALEADTSLGFDYDSSAEDFPGSDDGSLFSVLNVVKDIAVQDPRQDTPLFHFNLGIAYMQCADYEQAVDELLSALYGIPDKIGCYVRLAECSLKLQRRELACGFLREALDHPDIRSEQSQAVRQRLDEISAA